MRRKHGFGAAVHHTTMYEPTTARRDTRNVVNALPRATAHGSGRPPTATAADDGRITTALDERRARHPSVITLDPDSGTVTS